MKKWAWVRMKMEGDQAVRPFVYQLLIGSSWGDGSVPISEHDTLEEAKRLADFYNDQVVWELDHD